MAITYPITLPTSPSANGIEFLPSNNVGESRSPWTGQTQVQRWAAELWGARVSLPPMRQAAAAPWVAALQSLRGPWGTVYLGPLGYTPLGSAGSVHNLFTESEAHDLSPPWTKQDCSVTETTATAPDASATADRLVEGTGSSSKWIIQQETGEGSTWYCFSRYVKPAGRTKVIMWIGAGLTGQAESVLYDLSTGVSELYNNQGSPVYGMIDAGGGWWRCWMAVMSQVVPTPANFIMYFVSGTATGYTGDGTSGYYIWGSQLEKGKQFPGDYVPTTTAIVGLPVVDGAQSSGDTLATRGWAPNATEVMKAGDYVQAGSQLFQILTDVDADASGNATLDVWPAIRTSLADGLLIETDSPQGIFRLAGGAPSWQRDPSGIIAARSFELVEAL